MSVPGEKAKPIGEQEAIDGEIASDRQQTISVSPRRVRENQLFGETEQGH